MNKYIKYILFPVIIISFYFLPLFDGYTSFIKFKYWRLKKGNVPIPLSFTLKATRR